MAKKYLFIILISLAILTIAFLLLTKSSDNESDVLIVKAQRGSFNSMVYSTGQLESAKLDNIYIPEKMKDRQTRVYELTITDMIEDGTIVDSGDYVATLDHKVVEEQLSLALDELEKTYSEYEDSKIDSNLTLSNQRDEIVNAELDLEEKKILVTESTYESPSIQKKAQMDYNKAERKLEQVKKAYKLKTQQEINKVARKFINYKQVNTRVESLEELYKTLIIYSPRKGILSYYKYPWGEVVKTGSRASQWRSIIASFPDMTNLISRTYINEIDISKVKIGQKVSIGIDAFPEKELKGEVLTIANIGQLMPKSDAKVFEVKIKIFGTDEELKPSMTTKNIIQASFIEDTIYIPIEGVYRNDSLQYVYLKNKNITKQIVELGDENENFVVVVQGIAYGDEICLIEPKNAENISFTGMEIYAELKQKEEQKKLKEEALQTSAKSDNENKPAMPKRMIINAQ